MSPLGRTCALPSKLVRSAGEWVYCLIRLVVCVAVFSDTRTARPERTVGGPPPSSNIVIDPSGWIRASCWNTVEAPEPCLNVLWFEPSVHMIAPEDGSTLYTAQVLRIEMSRVPSGSSATEFRW